LEGSIELIASAIVGHHAGLDQLSQAGANRGGPQAAELAHLEGKIISRTEECHTHVEWLRFLKQIDRETPKELDLHLIIDNYATHKHPAVQHWLKAHSRFHMHFTPTSPHG
jgi:DDE superfamily endonuclease